MTVRTSNHGHALVGEGAPDPSMARIIVNTVPHCGTHLVASILNEIGYTHAQYRSLRRGRVRVGVNWRLSESFLNRLLRVHEANAAPISIASPQLVHMSLLKHNLRKVGPAEYFLSHAPFSENFNGVLVEQGWHGFVITRDPRDMCLSMISHVSKRPQHMAHRYLFSECETQSERIQSLLTGFQTDTGRWLQPLADMYSSILGWEQNPKFIFLRFEDLVGVKGGGTQSSQITAIERILENLQISDGSRRQYDPVAIGDRAFGKTTTFRKGQIGGWRKSFSELDKDNFKSEANSLLVKLEYETDDGW